MSDIKRMESSSKKITIIIEVEVFRRVESTHRLELLSCVAGWIFESVRLCNTNLLTGTMSKCVIKANDMSPQMSKFATKVGIEALQAAQTEQVRVTLAVSTCPKMFFFLVVARQQHYPACLPLSFVLVFIVQQTRNLYALTLFIFTPTVHECCFLDHAGSSIHY